MSRIYKDKYDCIVIGGSLSGLASALTLAKKGYSVLVLEQHNLPGGVATSFIRGGIEIEASLHEMMSIGPTYSPLKIRNFFDEMGIDIDWLRVPEAYRFVEPGLSAVVHAGDKGNFDVPAKDICDAVGDPDGKIFEKLMKLFTLCHNVYNSVNELSIHPVGKVAMLSKHSDFVKTAGHAECIELKAHNILVLASRIALSHSFSTYMDGVAFNQFSISENKFSVVSNSSFLLMNMGQLLVNNPHSSNFIWM